MSTDKIIVHVDPDIEALIPGFIANRHRDVTRLGELLESGDFDEIRVIGHSMKGAGGGYGFDEITTLGADIERAADANDHTGVRRALDALADYLTRVEPVFN